jgi:hypothetical protein
MERKKLSKKKPVKNPLEILSKGLAVYTQTQLAVNQVDFTNRLNALTQMFGGLAHNFEDMISQVNNANNIMAKRVQALESRCAELDSIICAREAETKNPETFN